MNQREGVSRWRVYTYGMANQLNEPRAPAVSYQTTVDIRSWNDITVYKAARRL